MTFDRILPAGNGGDDNIDIFSVESAGELEPIPPGRYRCVAECGGPKTSSTGKHGYEIRFRVLDGEFTGRKLWKFFSFTVKAAPISRRDLEKFGFSTMEQLQGSLPPERFLVELFVALRQDNSGRRTNDIKSIKVIGVQEPPKDPFAPEGQP